MNTTQGGTTCVGEEEDDRHQFNDDRGALLRAPQHQHPTPAPVPAPLRGVLDATDEYFAAAPNTIRYAVLLNSLMLIILIIVCLVMYHRVQLTLDRVDSITKLNPFGPK